MNEVWSDMRKAMERLEQTEMLRHPMAMQSGCGARVRVGGRELVCLCSNDYLGLAGDGRIKAAAAAAIRRWGVGAGASRLVSGTTELHVELERRLAELKGAEAAIVTPTGWMANHAAVHALVGGGDLVLCDKLNHASILDAVRSSGAEWRTYGHCGVERLGQLLERRRGKHRRCLIVTDSLFSMDGDLAPLGQFADLRDRFDALLMIDDAHATGVMGEHGRGAAEMLGVEGRVDVTVGTLSKALGGLGGFVAGPRALVDTIVNTARAYIYTTALPPALCSAAIEALDIVRDEPQRRLRLSSLAARLRSALREAGFDIGASVTQIIPVILGGSARAMAVSRALLEQGFLVPAIRPPTVPPNSSRLRVSLSAAHEDADVERFVAALRGIDLPLSHTSVE
jgi:8-amino-7-oxononanoate synthase